jgi:predicted adenine nucleotide alpha hydrolase (AANH) superfamily ATPase
VIVPDWSPKEWYEGQMKKPFGATHHLSTHKEYSEAIDRAPKHERCPRCWELRLKKTAEYAKRNGYEAFSSTLVTSQYQDSETIKKIALKIAQDNQIEFIVPEANCCELKTKGFYKQNFCGCVYSLKERFEEKYTEV